MFQRSNYALQIALIILITFCISPTLSHAHKVSIFAYVEGSEIFTESYFSKKKRVHQGKIEVYNLKTKDLILTGTTDDNGDFNFPIPNEITSDHTGLKIVLMASEGHRNEWILTSEDIFHQNSASNTSPASDTPANSASNLIDTNQSHADSTFSNIDISALNSQIKTLNNKIDTLKRLVIGQQEEGPGMKEIFSGIGYIFGLFGFAAFIASRKKN